MPATVGTRVNLSAHGHLRSGEERHTSIAALWHKLKDTTPGLRFGAQLSGAVQVTSSVDPLQANVREYGPEDRQAVRATLAHRAPGSTNAIDLPGGGTLEGEQLAAVLDGFARAQRFRAFHDLPNISDRGAFESMTCLCPNCSLRGVTFLHIFKSAGSAVNTVMEQSACGKSMFCQSRWGMCSHLFAKAHEPDAPPETEKAELREAHSAPGALLFSIVRHPIERFRSGLSELIRRGTIHSGFTVSLLLGRIAARGFFDPHLWPQLSE